eukprot:gnl/Hemi2/2494_TR879_c0_g15_i1.p1 gnl/Hemi2/2494_TR879_c0_g15~~gnl/Hemi2/2494_TR879_c0_g15_i1.p1  ORF type:complete len:119 (-),score=20.20 gnl/Hemi2/2494_TR879_c0_g15_i1:131-487(-)
MLTTFAMSAIVHEYIICLTLSFVYPVLFVMFGGFGVLFVYFTRKGKSRVWNLFFWLMLFFGTGLLICLYSLEYYARKNTPFSEGWVDFVTPRSWRLEWNYDFFDFDPAQGAPTPDSVG